MKNKIELENKYGWICPICKTLNKIQDTECTGGARHDLVEKSTTTASVVSVAERHSWPAAAAIINKSFSGFYYKQKEK